MTTSGENNFQQTKDYFKDCLKKDKILKETDTNLEFSDSNIEKNKIIKKSNDINNLKKKNSRQNNFLKPKKNILVFNI